MKRFKNFVFCLLLNLLALTGHAQFRQASIGINGLTCSQCSRSVEMQLRKLSFVKEVKMDLEHTEGTIVFKENKHVDMSAVAKAVKDAGFSVRYLKAAINSANVTVSSEGCFKLYGDVYYVARPVTMNPKPFRTLQFVGKDYLAKNDLKNFKQPVTPKCKGKMLYFTVADPD